MLKDVQMSHVSVSLKRAGETHVIKNEPVSPSIKLTSLQVLIQFLKLPVTFTDYLDHLYFIYSYFSYTL